MSIWGHSKCTKRVKRGRGLIEKETKSDIWEGGLSRKNENTHSVSLCFIFSATRFFLFRFSRGSNDITVSNKKAP